MFSSHPPSPEAACSKEETVTNWRLILATAGATVLFVTMLFGIAFMLPRGETKAAAPTTIAQAKTQNVGKKTTNAPVLTKHVSVPKPAPVTQLQSGPTRASPPAPRKPEIEVAQVSRRPAISVALSPGAISTRPMPKPESASLARSQERLEPLTPKFKRRQLLDELSLLAELPKIARELDLDKVTGSSTTLLTATSAGAGKVPKIPTVLDLLLTRDDLSGLPVRCVGSVG